MGEIVDLKTGEQLVVKVLEPPIGEYTDQIWCWSNIQDALLAGEMTPWIYTPYFIAEIDGEFAGSLSYFTPADTRDVGLIEFVQTVEAHRQKGIASVLLSRAVERFRANGGLALYLCTNNPIAGRLYENHGFWYYVGDGMRYLSPDARDFDTSYLAFCGRGKVRDATWGDIPRASVLYNHPEPRWVVKDYLTQCFRDMRYESHFVKLMKRIEDRMGAFVVLENPGKRVVGAAALERLETFYEQHVAILSFRVCPAYFEQASELLSAAADRARNLSIGRLQVYIADCDDEQKELVKSAGFSEEARLRDRLRWEDRWMDLLVYTLSVDGDASPLRSEDGSYGSRKPWQVERIATVR